ncbi:hypothetical protein ACFLV5_00535 [Chloroflexota bacterium]
MLDTDKYIIDEPYQQYGNGYDQLEGDWLLYYKVANRFVHKAQAQDRNDLLHDIILNLSVAGRNNGHKLDNPSWMYRIASFTVTQYWRDYYRRVNGIDCVHCSNKQRKKCKADDLFDQCPRAIKIESLQRLSQSHHILIAVLLHHRLPIFLHQKVLKVIAHPAFPRAKGRYFPRPIMVIAV